jgi:hypothetical protein
VDEVLLDIPGPYYLVLHEHNHSGGGNVGELVFAESEIAAKRAATRPESRSSPHCLSYCPTVGEWQCNSLSRSLAGYR